MDTREVAERLGTDPKTLRRFLRDPSSTFQAVGSGGRYQFTDRDIPTLAKRFADWSKGQVAPKRTPSVRSPRAVSAFREVKLTQSERDRLVWEKEEQERAERGLGPIALPSIRNPHVVKAVRREAAERAARLDALLLSKGLHISQWRERV